MNFFQLCNKWKSVGSKSAKYDGWRSSLKLAIWVAVSACDDVSAGDDMAHRVATFLAAYLSAPLDIF